MAEFVQVHLLTAYPPSNPNRDDAGQPKSAIYGNVPRARISSQALKRAMRTSDSFLAHLGDNRGIRTQRYGEVIRQHLVDRGIDDERALAVAKRVADAFGKLETDAKKATFIRQLAFLSPEEVRAATDLADRLADDDSLQTKDIQKEAGQAAEVLRQADSAIDIAMFGRMLADDPEFNREAAVQVSHALTTHKVVIEDDYYTAVDDLKKPSEDMGAGFIGELGFTSGLFYLYLCINADLLLCNLDGRTDLAQTGLKALLEAAATASPGGKKSSFAHNPRAEYILVERGAATPRSLASAFLRPIGGSDVRTASVEAMTRRRARFAELYGETLDSLVLDVEADSSATLAEVMDFAASAVPS